ncbi:MAG: hypothetical protein V3V47_01915 [Desulfobacteria bacterium]
MENEESIYACPSCHHALTLAEDGSIVCDREGCASKAAGIPQNAGDERLSYERLAGAVKAEDSLKE